MRALLVLVAFLICAPPATAQPHSVVLQAPARDFGYVIGDILVTEAVITLDRAAILDTHSLPVAGPVDPAIDLRRVQVSDRIIGASREVRIRAEYQSFFAPEQVMQTALPGYGLRFFQDGLRTEVVVPAWAYHVSPLRVAQSVSADLADLRSDHPILPLPLRAVEVRIVLSGVVLVLAALALAGTRGWVPAFGHRPQPFAQAARQIGALSASDGDRKAALRAVHLAFNSTAGHPVLADDFDAFLASHPRYAPLRADIAWFYAESTAVFFSPISSDQHLPTTLHTFARNLRRVERQW